MRKLRDIVADIIVELTKLQAVPIARRSDGDRFPLPRMIAAGDGGGIVISESIDIAIAEVAQRLLDGDPQLKLRYTEEEWRAAVRRAFGPALATIDLDHCTTQNANLVLAEVREAVSKDWSVDTAREHAFGCTLFSDTNASAFTIGPVRFERREDWLARQVAGGFVSTITERRIGRAWQGRTLNKRKISAESRIEDDILAAIGACPFVCSVTTNGLADDAAKEKALTAARLALTAIALLWQTPSKALSGFNLLFDRTPRRLKTLTFVPKKIVLSGSTLSHMPHGPWLKAGEWEKLMTEWSDHFAITAEIIQYVLSPTGKVGRPALMNALAQALLWFHEGCRETVSLMAIVKFTASLDALASGDKEAGILRLISARVGLQANDPIRSDGPTVKASIRKIYGDGRSRTIHGTNDALGHDWSGTRGLAEQFARLCLVTSMDWAADNPTLDDPSLLQKS